MAAKKKATDIGSAPVLPMLVADASGVIGSWYPVDERGARPASMATSAVAPKLTRFQIEFYSTSASLAASLSLGSIFTGGISADSRAVFFDAVANTKYFSEQVTGDGAVLYSIREGIGCRLALKARKFNSSLGFSYPALAAQARISGAEIAYELQGVGLHPSLVRELLGAAPIGNLADDNAYSRIDTFLHETLPKYLEDETKPLTVSKYAAVPRARQNKGELNEAFSINLAMTMIAKRKSLQKALEKAAEYDGLYEADPFLVTYVYSSRGGVADGAPDAVPPEGSAEDARNWLRQS